MGSLLCEYTLAGPSRSEPPACSASREEGELERRRGGGRKDNELGALIPGLSLTGCRRAERVLGGKVSALVSEAAPPPIQLCSPGSR